MGEGRAAQRAGRHADAVKAFDQVLARAPLFEERHAMAPAYVAHAEELLAKGDREQAAMLLRKARRLTPKDADTSRIEAQLTVLEAEQLIEEGIPDRFLLQRALELDPDNARAKELMASLATEAEARQDES